MVLSQLEKKGLVKYLGEEASLQSRRMLEQAGLTQHGLRKVSLYVAVTQMSEAERKYPITSDLEHILLDKAIQLSEAWRELETLRKLAILS